MKLTLRQIEAPLNYDNDQLIQLVCQRLECKAEIVNSCEIIRRSLDTRPRRKAPVYIMTLEVELSTEIKIKADQNTVISQSREEQPVSPEMPSRSYRPIVVGAGPAGLMAALSLAEAGLKPILIERGSKAEDRKGEVDSFWREGVLNPENNVLFGEGGAGLFSDGKLTARSKDKPAIKHFFATLVKCGAPESILIDAEPHVGSDVLMTVIARMRELIITNGGEIRYQTPLEDIIISDGAIQAVKAGGNTIETRQVILATGHSARDIYQLLADRGIDLEAKAFAAGVRVELPQQQIDASQYGHFSDTHDLNAASFRLTRRPEKNYRACYSFCMCPGGLVINCASEAGAMTTNGMSYSKRSGIWGNAAFVVPVEPEDYMKFDEPYKHQALKGLNFQLSMEQAAFSAGGSNFMVPALRLKDFLAGTISATLPDNRSCLNSVPADFDKILPDYILKTLRYALPRMLSQLNRARINDITVYGAETRSSSPVRIMRNENCMSTNVKGLYPSGEGAGYAGGIVSSALDGLKTASFVAQNID